ncbi:MAG: hypothetical protein M0R40_00660 [Firmicutes bacterium]|nr:hypothetical protein [Bacillota bacterium]
MYDLMAEVREIKKEVQALRDELSLTKRKYEDLLYNLDDDNFSGRIRKEKDGMKTEIDQTADRVAIMASDINGLDSALIVEAGRITQVVSAVYGDVIIYSNSTSPYLPPEGADREKTYYNLANQKFYKFESDKWVETTAPVNTMQSQVVQTAGEISSVVENVFGESETSIQSQITQTAGVITQEVTDRQTADGLLQSDITQTAASIKQTVQANYGNPVEINDLDDRVNKSKLYYYEPGNLYYFWNGEAWESTSQANFGTVFEQTATGFKLKGNVSIKGDLITSGKIKTSDFDGVGNDYIQMQREFITFRNDELIKMALGFVKDKDGTGIPGIVLGAGDGTGKNVGYITKDATGIDIFYITEDETAVRLRLDESGKIFLNGTEVPAFDEDNPLQDDYIAKAEQWNKAVLGTKDTDGEYRVTNSEIKDGANISAAKIESLIVGTNVTMGADAVIEWTKVNNKPDFKTVATSGSYSDLTNKPSIPTVPSYITSTKITQTTIESPSITGGTITGGEVRSNLSSTTYGQYISLNSSDASLDLYYQSLGGSPEHRGTIYQAGGSMYIKPMGASVLYIGNEPSGGNTHKTYPVGTWDFTNATVDNLLVYARFM